MKWLAPSEALRLSHDATAAPQTLVLSCETNDFASRVPAEPRIVSTDEGVPADVNEWVALLHDRPVIVQQERDPVAGLPPSVTIVTPFATAPPGPNQWATLRELDDLPRPIRPSRPMFIESHTGADTHVVYRPNSAGWDDAVYHASSRADAESLVRYLTAKDSWNDGCFVGRPEPAGQWGIVRQDRQHGRVFGAYPDLNSALRVACELSSDSAEDVLLVRDLSKVPQPRTFRVSRGMVRPLAPRAESAAGRVRHRVTATRPRVMIDGALVMAKSTFGGEYKAKFRPEEAQLDQEVEAALAGVALEDMYEKDRAAPAAADGTPPAAGAGATGNKAARRGRVVSVNKEDAFVDFGGKSQGICSMLQFEAEPKVGEEYDFTVQRYDKDEGLLVLSRRGATVSNVTWENLEVGQIVEGTVTGTNKGGLELEVKAMRAFMPAGQVEIYHVPDLTDFIGKKLQAEVTQFDPGAKNLILSRRNILEREREAAKQQLMTELVEGQVRRGTVRSVMDFGAFVDLGGVDGLLHVSEMTFKRGRHNANDFVKVGDVMDVKVTRIDKETGKLSLSLKQALGTDPWADAGNKYAPGTEITGRVVRVEGFGAFIEVEEGFEGLLPVSEMSWQRIRHPSDVVKDGDTVRLVVLSVDPAQRRISFSLKQAGPDPWKTIAERYAAGMTVTGNVTRMADFGAFVEIEPGLEGLIHVSELSNQRVRSPGDVVKVGQEVTVRVLDMDAAGRRMSLSMRGAGGTGGKAGSSVMAAAPAAAVAPTTAKKRPQLRGGLDL